MNVKKSVFIAFRLLLGIAFLASGIGKAMDPKSFSMLISDYGFGHLSLLSPLVIIVELALGIALLLKIRIKDVTYVTSLLLVVFTGLFTYAFLYKGITDCGCFGSLTKPVSPILFYIKNSVLIFFSVLLYLRKDSKEKTGRFKRNLFFSLLLGGVYLTGFSYNNPISAPKAVEPIFLKDKLVKNTKLKKLVNVHKDSTYMVFLFSYTCSYCLNSIEKIDDYKSTNSIDKLILVGSGSTLEKNDFYQTFEIAEEHIDISKEEMKKIVNYYPRTFFIKNNRIIDELIGELPSVKDLKVHKILKSLNE